MEPRGAGSEGDWGRATANAWAKKKTRKGEPGGRAGSEKSVQGAIKEPGKRRTRPDGPVVPEGAGFGGMPKSTLLGDLSSIRLLSET